MSTTSCSLCGNPSSFMSRFKGRLLCSQCLFNQTIQSTESLDREEKRGVRETEVQLQGEIEENKKQAEALVNSQATVELQQDWAASAVVPLQIPTCERHNQPAVLFCMCAGEAEKVYLCRECSVTHCSKVELIHEVFSLGPGDSVPIPTERRLLIAKISELRSSLYQQKASFDQQLQCSLHEQKSLLDSIYQGIHATANVTFATLQETLDLALTEVTQWRESRAELSSSTRLLIDHCDQPVEKFTFFDFDAECKRCVHIETTKSEETLQPWEDLLNSFGPLCECDKCEKTRESLGMLPAKPWVCLNCNTTRSREMYCKKCGCGRTVVDFLAYHEVEVIENGTKWVCKSCKIVNPCRILKCERCCRNAQEPAGIPWHAIFSSIV